jgi:hypothetical protein
VILNRGNVDRPLSLPNDGGYQHLERWVYAADAAVVAGNFARMPAGPAPWLVGTPMAVAHDQSALDPSGLVTFTSPKYSLTFLTRTNPPPPSVPGFAVNGGAAQRSMVTGLTVEFNTEVTLQPGALVLTDAAGVPVAGVTPQWVTALVNGRTVATVTFTGPAVQAGSLADGRYRLVVRADRVTNALGVPMAADQAIAFHRLYGDVTGDGTVNGADFNPFRLAFGAGAGSPNFRADFDVNGDGVINGADFNEFRLRFGLSV